MLKKNLLSCNHSSIPNMKKIFLKHKVLLIILGIIFIAGYIVNFFIPKNTITLVGEYIFSFDYFGHLKNILFDNRSLLAQDNTNCFDCVDFYHYSRWYSLFKIGYQSISQVLFLHPIVFYFLSMIVTQFVSLYIFVQVLFKKVSWTAFIIAAFVFIFYPYKYSLLVETHDGVMYSNLLLYFTLLIWTCMNIEKIKSKKLVIVSILTGILFSLFFNISVAFFPIVIFVTILIYLFFAKTLLKNIKKTIMFSSIFLGLSILINIPFISSLFANGSDRHYLGYLSYGSVDSFLAGLNLAQTDINIIKGFGVLFAFCFLYATISFKKKIALLLGYLFVASIMLGTKSPINIFGWMFDKIPLMDSLQATHRFLFFDFVFFFIVSYFALQRLFKGYFVSKAFFFIIGGIFIALPIMHITQHANYLFVSQLPQEYFDAQQYLNSFPDEKMYFPPTTKILHSLATDYTWSNGESSYNQSILLYKNPYTSLLPIRNLVQFERFPYLLSPHFLELRYLTDLQLPQEQIIRAMELRGIRYIIVDKNFKWQENYPNFDVDSFIKLATLKKQFGNIYILSLPDLTYQCKSGYGTISLEYCTTESNPQTLLSKTKEEYQLEVNPEKVGKNLLIRHDSIYTKNILDPKLHQSFIDNRILFGKDIMQVDGNQTKVLYSKPLKKGKYILHVQLFKYDKAKDLMGDATISVMLSGKQVRKISSYSSSSNLYWESIPFYANNGHVVTIDIDGQGYVLFGSVPVLEMQK